MENKVVVITGASSGIGEALAKKFAEVKSKVVLAARDTIKLFALAEKLKSLSIDCLVVACDVSIENDCKRLIDEAVNKYGKIDVLINNAGITMRALFNETELSVFRKVMDVDFWGTVNCTKYALPHLLKSKGSLVGISSIAGKKGLPGRSGYSSAKFAMEGFLETVRTENLRNELHVLVACPGFTASNIRNAALSADGSQQGESPRDEKGMMTAEEVAGNIYKAVKNRKRDLLLTLNGKLTVWLNKFFPAFMDKVVYNHMSKEPNSPFK